MPGLRFASATSADALSTRKFSVVPVGGAVLNLWASASTAGDTWGISIGDRDIFVNGSELNIEIAVDVVDVQRDQLAFNELIGGGQLFMPLTTAAEIQALIHLRYL